MECSFVTNVAIVKTFLLPFSSVFPRDSISLNKLLSLKLANLWPSLTTFHIIIISNLFLKSYPNQCKANKVVFSLNWPLLILNFSCQCHIETMYNLTCHLLSCCILTLYLRRLMMFSHTP
jgi:hypothetical protein